MLRRPDQQTRSVCHESIMLPMKISSRTRQCHAFVSSSKELRAYYPSLQSYAERGLHNQDICFDLHGNGFLRNGHFNEKNDL